MKCGMRRLGVLNPNGTGERFILRQVISNLANPVLFDIGAHTGCWSKMALEINPKCSIYAFEPNPNNYEKLKELPNTRAFNLACSSQPGTAILYDRADSMNTEHASLERVVVSRLNQGVREYAVGVTTLDEAIHSEKIKNIDLLKIDVEGFEYDVLLGAKYALSNGLIKNIQIEFNEMNVFRRRFFRDFCELLPDFSFYRILPTGLIPMEPYDPILHELFSYQNLLAKRNEVNSKTSEKNKHG